MARGVRRETNSKKKEDKDVGEKTHEEIERPLLSFQKLEEMEGIAPI